MATNLDNRLVEVETRMAYLEDANQTLSDALIEAHAKIEALEQRIEKLRGEFDQAVSPPDADERPPHY